MCIWVIQNIPTPPEPVVKFNQWRHLHSQPCLTHLLHKAIIRSWNYTQSLQLAINWHLARVQISYQHSGLWELIFLVSKWNPFKYLLCFSVASSLVKPWFSNSLRRIFFFFNCRCFTPLFTSSLKTLVIKIWRKT